MFSGKWSVDSLPDFSNKSLFITGATNGIGKIAVMVLAKKNMGKIYLAARNPTKAQETIEEIHKQVPGADIEFIQLDISDLDQVKKVSEKFANEHVSLNYLINNAGIMATPYKTDHYGYEMQWSTNYMGHALLTRNLLPVLDATAKEGQDVKIVNVTSYAHNFAPKVGINFDDVNLEKGSIWDRYGESKLANILFNNELEKRYPNIKSFAAHPGFVRTDLYDGINQSYGIFGKVINMVSKPFYLTPDEGALTTLYCLSPEADSKAGEYLVPFGKVGKSTANAKDADLSLKLWDWTTAEFLKNKLI